MNLTAIFAIMQATLLSLFRHRLTGFLLSLIVLFTGLSLFMATVDAGVRFRLFENLLIGTQTLLLYGIAWLYSFEILRREQSDQLYILPLSTGLSRRDYILGRFLGLACILCALGICLLIIDMVLIICLQNTIVWQPLMAIVISMFAAILAAALVFAFGMFTSAFNAVIYSVLFWIIGHGLDELYIFAEQRMSAIAQTITPFFYYLLPNFSMTDMSSIVLNRLPMSTWDWLFPIVYSVGYSTLLLWVASAFYQRKVLTGND